MNKAEAIKVLAGLLDAFDECEHGDYFYDRGEEVCEATILAHAALREQEQREHGCEYCRGEKVKYQHTKTTDLHINTFGQARTLEVECMHCPPFTRCSMAGVPARSAFLIKYCPECGRKLKEGAEG